MIAEYKDISHINDLYNGRSIFYGDLHNHASTGGTSDGSCTLSEWKLGLQALAMDFVAILDHRQVRHMYLPEWEDGLFISGTEPGTEITDCTGSDKSMHYNMLFPSHEMLEEILCEFEEYEFTGGPEGHFIYPSFTRARFGQLVDAVKAKGGFFVHPHPMLCMKSDDPEDYYFRDETGIEVFYGDMGNEMTEKNYKLWTTLLDMGKRVWACAGQDGHRSASDKALTAIYSESRTGKDFISHLRQGDFVCGSVALRMCVNETKMGGATSFDNGRLVLAVDDFHVSVRNTDHKFRVDIISDLGLEFSQEIACDEPSFIAFDTENRKFYRAEIFDETLGLRIAIGNPIWNK